MSAKKLSTIEEFSYEFETKFKKVSESILESELAKSVTKKLNSRQKLTKLLYQMKK